MKPLPVFDSCYTYKYECVYDRYPRSIYYVYLIKNYPNDSFTLQINEVSIVPKMDGKFFSAILYNQIVLFQHTNFQIIKQMIREYLRTTQGLIYLLRQMYNDLEIMRIYSHILDRKIIKKLIYKSYEFDDDML